MTSTSKTAATSTRSTAFRERLLAVALLAVFIAVWLFLLGGREWVQAQLEPVKVEETAPAAPSVPTPAAPAASAAQAPASAASASAQAASAAAPAAAAPAAAAPASAPVATPAPAVHAKTEEENKDTDQGDSIIDYTVRSGDWLIRLWPDDWREVCKQNKLQQNCNHIEVGQVLKYRAAIMPVVRQVKSTVATAAKAQQPEAHVATMPAAPSSTGEFQWIKINGAPLRGCGNKDAATINEETWADYIRRGLMTEAERAELRELTKGMREPNISLLPEEGRVDLIPGMHFGAVSLCGRDGKATLRTNVRVAWDAVKTGPVYGQQFRLKSTKQDDSAIDTVWVWVRSCHNWVIHRVEKQRPPVSPPRDAEPPVCGSSHTRSFDSAPEAELCRVGTATSVTTDVTTRTYHWTCEVAGKEPAMCMANLPPVPTKPVPKGPTPLITPPVDDYVLKQFDSEFYEHLGGDRDVIFGGFEGAAYPSLNYRQWGRYDIGIGGFAGAWRGETPTEFAHGGSKAAIGLAEKWSTYERRSVGLKFPMIGYYQDYGRQGAFASQRHAVLGCASLSYDDASRERYGERTLPEFEVWTSYCKVLSQAKSHQWFGQALSGESMADLKRIVGAGVRVYLSKDMTGVMGHGGVAAKVQPFIEAGANETAPYPHTAHLYVGLRTVDKVWGCGAGVHASQAGRIPGLTCTHNLGRHLELRWEQERWIKFNKGFEALGIAID